MNKFKNCPECGCSYFDFIDDSNFGPMAICSNVKCNYYVGGKSQQDVRTKWNLGINSTNKRNKSNLSIFVNA